ncbi:transcriptional repressor [Campylobacter sp. FMV-PI01]|uniref:Ferric uptake regulation protein n=1 Tax=Campylobacter portucalensis TaxID=2608384 RepID=A0A6L5WKC0_9BACT|nr:transcriptional repressor [Campylobacter portucalensis]MSN96687.1 transcriptional repressor [Campylobacter portucalensis]
MSEDKIFSSFLNIILSRNSKNSTPRERILKILFYNKHISVNEIQKIYKNLHKKSVNISTIYQTLNLLQSYNFLTTIKHSKTNKYEININLNHDHIICSKCGKIVEFRDDDLQDLEIQISQKYNFLVEGHILLLDGICFECLNKN